MKCSHGLEMETTRKPQGSWAGSPQTRSLARGVFVYAFTSVLFSPKDGHSQDFSLRGTRGSAQPQLTHDLSVPAATGPVSFLHSPKRMPVRPHSAF